MTEEQGLASKATGKRVADLFSQRVGKALAHPLRVQILNAAASGPISPSDFARKFQHDLSESSYHFRRLQQLDCLEIVDEEPQRGALEHYYRATRRALFDEEDWALIPESMRGGVSEATVRDFLEHLAKAFEAGTFDKRDDRHLTWTTAVVDEEGWKAIVTIMLDAYFELERVREESALRLGKSQGPQIPITFSLMAFESPTADTAA